MNTQAPDPRQSFRVAGWLVRPTAGELLGPDDEARHLEPKVMDVLVELARAWPEVLERETAIERVWAGRPVADDGLARCVAELRKVFRDSRGEPRFIQTVPKRGYRLVADVSYDEKPPGLPAHEDPPVEDWSGPVEFDNLRIIRPLGRGSMGVVHLAQETNLERLVAIKTLRGVIASDERAVHRFRREASAAARIQHPNVIGIHRLGELPDGSQYLVMQFVRGRTLTAVMASSGEMQRASAVAIVRQLAAALVAAHAQRVIHRDVKPANVLIAENSGTAILGDFGIAGMLETGARVATRLTRQGEVLGDARYISPEQARGEAPSPASDVYSLGVIAYELITGAYPYAENGGAKPHIEAAPRPMSDFVDDIDAVLERSILQALAKAADDRPTAQQFLDQLVLPQVARPPPTGSTARTPAYRRPLMWVIVAGILAAISWLAVR